MDRRTALATALLTLLSPITPAHAAADPAPAPTTIYFGNGCFWGRQKDFVDVEQQVLNRPPERVSAVVGYAGGRSTSPDGKVCYYYSNNRANVYERLGHAEVVSVQLDAGEAAKKQMEAFAQQYFEQFRRLPWGGMQRLVRWWYILCEILCISYLYSFVLAPCCCCCPDTPSMRATQDPQDKGPGYRNVVGIPGGIDSPLFEALPLPTSTTCGWCPVEEMNLSRANRPRTMC